MSSRSLRALTLIAVLTTTSCATVVRRWTLEGPERAGASLPATRHPDSFDDLFWSTPPIASRRLKLVPAGPSRVARVVFAGLPLELSFGADDTLSVSQLTRGASVSLNGRTYRHKEDEAFAAAIEYGTYELRITRPGAADQVDLITVDESHPTVHLEYHASPSGGLSVANMLRRHENWPAKEGGPTLAHRAAGLLENIQLARG